MECHHKLFSIYLSYLSVHLSSNLAADWSQTLKTVTIPCWRVTKQFFERSCTGHRIGWSSLVSIFAKLFRHTHHDVAPAFVSCFCFFFMNWPSDRWDVHLEIHRRKSPLKFSFLPFIDDWHGLKAFGLVVIPRGGWSQVHPEGLSPLLTRGRIFHPRWCQIFSSLYLVSPLTRFTRLTPYL